MIKPEEVPMWAGLMEYDFEEDKFKTKIPAPLQSRNTPSWGLICSLVRRVRKAINRDEKEQEINDLKNVIRAYERELKHNHNILKQLANKQLDEQMANIVLSEYKNVNFVYLNL